MGRLLWSFGRRGPDVERARNDMDGRIIDVANAIQAGRYKDTVAIFAAGSLVRGEGTPFSDLDLVVVYAQLPCASGGRSGRVAIRSRPSSMIQQRWSTSSWRSTGQAAYRRASAPPLNAALERRNEASPNPSRPPEGGIQCQ
jgi:hypothetical protein